MTETQLDLLNRFIELKIQASTAIDSQSLKDIELELEFIWKELLKDIKADKDVTNA